MNNDTYLEIEMENFRSSVRRASVDETEQIIIKLQTQLESLPKGISSYEICSDKLFFAERHLLKKKAMRIQKEKKPWNLV